MSESARRLRVFMCHSSSDKPAVRALYERLLEDGIQPWLDEEDLLPGQHWEQEIPKAVRKSDVVIVCLSQQSVTKAGYLQKEIKLALDVADEQPEGTIYVIPVKLEECDLPDRLNHLHWDNLFDARGYERLLRALQRRASTLEIVALPPPDVPRVTDWIPLVPAKSSVESYLDRMRAHTEAKARRPDIEGHIVNPTATNNEFVRRGEIASFVTLRAVFSNKGADTTISSFGIEIRLDDSVRTESKLFKGPISREVTGEKTGKDFRNLAGCLDHDKILGRNQHRDGYLQFIVEGVTVRELVDRDVILTVTDGAMKPHRLSGDRIRAGQGEGGLEVSQREEGEKLRIARQLNEYIDEGNTLLENSTGAEPPREAIAAWEVKVRTYIEETLGEFESLEWHKAYPQMPYPGGAVYRDVVNRQHTLLQRLGELITRLGKN